MIALERDGRAARATPADRRHRATGRLRQGARCTLRTLLTALPVVGGLLGADLGRAGASDDDSQTLQKSVTRAPTDQYQLAMRQLRVRDHAAAERLLEDFIASYPEHPLVENAAYWLAEIHYDRRDYARAAVMFAGNYIRYGKNGNKSLDNLVKLAMSLRLTGQAEKACLVFAAIERIYTNLPTHIEALMSSEEWRSRCE